MSNFINVTSPLFLSYIKYSRFLGFWNCECLTIRYPIHIP